MRLLMLFRKPRTGLLRFQSKNVEVSNRKKFSSSVELKVQSRTKKKEKEKYSCGSKKVRSEKGECKNQDKTKNSALNLVSII